MSRYWNNTTFVPINNTEDSGFPPIVRHIYVGYYVIIFFMATVGNLFAILTCYKNFKQSSAILLAYIASLAVADLLFTLLTPVDLAAFLAGSWVCGPFLCRFQSFLIESSYTASIITLAAISHERFKAVSTPLLARSQRISQRKFIPVFIWIISIISCTPLLYAYVIIRDENGVEQCVNIAWGDGGRQIYYSVQGVILFLLPLLYMVYAHVQIFRILKKHALTREKLASKQVESRSQRRIGKMLMIVTCIFVTCYFPFVFIRSMKYFGLFNQDMIWRLVQLMIFTQAAVNPVIYCFYNKQFRVVFKDLLRCRWSTVRHRPEISHSGGTVKTRSLSMIAASMKLEPLQGSSGYSTPVLKLEDVMEESELIEAVVAKMEYSELN